MDGNVDTAGIERVPVRHRSRQAKSAEATAPSGPTADTEKIVELSREWEAIFADETPDKQIRFYENFQDQVTAEVKQVRTVYLDLLRREFRPNLVADRRRGRGGGSAFTILDAIADRTLGLNRIIKQVSLSAFERGDRNPFTDELNIDKRGLPWFSGTGLARHTIIDNLTMLLGAGWLFRIERKTGAYSRDHYYGLNLPWPRMILGLRYWNVAHEGMEWDRYGFLMEVIRNRTLTDDMIHKWARKLHRQLMGY
jgi:hypothetical protein